MRIGRFHLVVLLLCCFGWFEPKEIPAQAQAPAPKRPMTFADLMQMRRLGSTDVSPDGKWLVYSVTDVDLAKNTKTVTLWIQPIAGGEPRRLEGTQAGDDGARFSHDGKRLLYLSSREAGQQVWIADFDGATGVAGGNRRLTPGNALPAAANTAPGIEADNAEWSPDGKSIVFTAAVYPDCAPIVPGDAAGEQCNSGRDAAQAASPVKARIFTHLLYRHWNAYTGDKRSHLFLLDVATGGLRDLNPNDPRDVPPFSLGGGGGFAFSPDSKELAFTENPDEEPAISTSAQIYTLDLTDPTAKPVKISTSAGGNFNPAYSPDGKYLAWRSQARAGYESDKFRLALYDRGTKKTRDLLPKFENWVDQIEWSPNSNGIYFTSEVAGEGPIKLGLLNGSVETISDDGTYNDLHPLPDSSTIVASRATIDSPNEVIETSGPVASQPSKTPFKIPGIDGLAVVEGETVATVSNVTNLNVSLWMQLERAKLESFWFPTSDGVKVQGFLIKPPGFDPSKKYPVKFLIHGGPQGAWGDGWSYRWNPELFAANGYVVLMINPRGSTGYGQAFVDGVNGDWGGKPFTDLMTGLDYAEKTYPFIDKNRECALGASYGGYMANWILGHTTRFKCIVTHDGMFNPESAYGSTEELWFNEWEFKTPTSNGGKPWDDYGRPDAENPFRKWSPALSAKNFKTPTLVIHSQLDYRLDVSEGFQLFTTLQRLKVPSKMLYFPDEGHWVLKPQNSQLWYKTVNDWVDQWTGKAGNRE